MKDYKETIKNYRMKGVGRLFLEMKVKNPTDTFDPCFNCSEDDTETTVSLKKLYLKYYFDPTDVTFVDEELCGRYDIWSAILKHKELSETISVWKEEARARFLSDNFKALHKISQEADAKTAVGALKYITSAVLGDSKGSDRGRPSKREIMQRTNELLSEDRDIREAFERIQAPIPTC